jgi:hypothetical protein
MKKYILCQVCENVLPKKFLDLGKQPLCDDLINIKKNIKCKLFPIKVSLCPKCLTANQLHEVNEKILFPKNYHYRARLTEDVLKGMNELVSSTVKLCKNKNKKYTVLDIGCNDGSLLNYFYKENFNTIGVEPTNAAKDCNKKHKIYNSYFNSSLAKKIINQNKQVDVITFTNVFAHINNFPELTFALKIIIKANPRVLIIIENHYLGSILKKKQFDTFYQEHPRTYSLNSFAYIGKLLNLNLSKVKFPKRYGGNIRVYYSTLKAVNVNKILREEKKFIPIFNSFNSIIKKWVTKKRKEIKNIKKDYTIIGKAFPGRASILINLLKVNREDILCIYEKENSKKIGFKVPGTTIPIVSDKNLYKIKNKNNFLIINFAWHIKDEIKKYLKKRGIKNKLLNIIESKDFS